MPQMVPVTAILFPLMRTTQTLKRIPMRTPTRENLPARNAVTMAKVAMRPIQPVAANARR